MFQEFWAFSREFGHIVESLSLFQHFRCLYRRFSACIWAFSFGNDRQNAHEFRIENMGNSKGLFGQALPPVVRQLEVAGSVDAAQAGTGGRLIGPLPQLSQHNMD